MDGFGVNQDLRPSFLLRAQRIPANRPWRDYILRFRLDSHFEMQGLNSCLGILPSGSPLRLQANPRFVFLSRYS